MSDSYILLTLSNRPRIVEEVLLSIVESCRLSWGHPDTGTVKAASGSSELKDTTRDQLLGTIRRDNDVMFQLWWEGYWDLCCIFHSSATYHSLNFLLAGVEQHNRDRLYESVMQVVSAYAKTIALVVIDWVGDTAEANYEAMLETGFDSTDPFPDVLLIGRHSVQTAHSLDNRFAFSPVNDAVVRVFPISQTASDK